MTLEERLKVFKEKGWTYNKDTGEIFSHTGTLITGKSRYIYCSLWTNKTSIKVAGHQLAFYLATGEIPNIIDHINRIKKDNRLVNLRNVTKQENNFNSDAKGYYWNKRDKKWLAKITTNGKTIHLGIYDNEDEAHQAYLKAKKIYHKFQ